MSFNLFGGTKWFLPCSRWVCSDWPRQSKRQRIDPNTHSVREVALNMAVSTQSKSGSPERTKRGLHDHREGRAAKHVLKSSTQGLISHQRITRTIHQEMHLWLSNLASRSYYCQIQFWITLHFISGWILSASWSIIIQSMYVESEAPGNELFDPPNHPQPG